MAISLANFDDLRQDTFFVMKGVHKDPWHIPWIPFDIYMAIGSLILVTFVAYSLLAIGSYCAGKVPFDVYNANKVRFLVSSEVKSRRVGTPAYVNLEPKVNHKLLIVVCMAALIHLFQAVIIFMSMNINKDTSVGPYDSERMAAAFYNLSETRFILATSRNSDDCQPLGVRKNERYARYTGEFLICRDPWEFFNVTKTVAEELVDNRTSLFVSKRGNHAVSVIVNYKKHRKSDIASFRFRQEERNREGFKISIVNSSSEIFASVLSVLGYMSATGSDRWGFPKGVTGRYAIVNSSKSSSVNESDKTLIVLLSAGILRPWELPHLVLSASSLINAREVPLMKSLQFSENIEDDPEVSRFVYITSEVFRLSTRTLLLMIFAAALYPLYDVLQSAIRRKEKAGLVYDMLSETNQNLGGCGQSLGDQEWPEIDARISETEDKAHIGTEVIGQEVKVTHADLTKPCMNRLRSLEPGCQRRKLTY